MRKPICHNWGAQISLRCLICLRAAVVGITSANTSIAKPFPWYWSYNRTLDVLVLWGRRNKKKTCTILMKLGWMCAIVLKKISLEKQQILIQENLGSFLIVKAHCSITHLKEQKSFGFFPYTAPWMYGCNRSHILHPWPNGVLEETKWCYWTMGLNNEKTSKVFLY